MNKLVTDNPQDNFSFIFNYVFSRDGQAYIRTDEDRNGVLLTKWMKAQCIAHGCTELEDVNVEDIDEIISDCAFDFDTCPLFVLYICACQAVHLRDRLKAYEDTGFMPTELRNIQKEAPQALTQEDLNRMHFDKVWLSCGSDPDHGEDGEWAVVIYGQIYSIETLDGSGFEDLLQDSLYGETLDNPSGQYKVYRRPPEKKEYQMKTDNDYLAEYVREQYPEIENSVSFLTWKLIKEIFDNLIALFNK